jgi:23S rRNA (adenine2503-C2)-methyltransferase
MAGVNDSARDAEKLAGLLKGLHCKLNLIAFNEFPGSANKTPAEDSVSAFQKILLRNHYTAILKKQYLINYLWKSTAIPVTFYEITDLT